MMERESSGVSSSSYKGANPIEDATCITSSKPDYLPEISLLTSSQGAAVMTSAHEFGGRGHTPIVCNIG